VFQELARDIQHWISTSMPDWTTRYPGVETLNVAVMGCIVNGPGESKHADIGISLPGTGEVPTAPVFVDRRKVATLRGPAIASDFKAMVAADIETRFGAQVRDHARDRCPRSCPARHGGGLTGGQHAGDRRHVAKAGLHLRQQVAAQ
jgi:hypothetical protein